MRRISLSNLIILFLLLSVHAQNPDSAKAHFDRALALSQQQKFDEAVSELDLAIQENGRFVEAYGLRGSIRFVKQDLELALSDFNSVIELAPQIRGIEVVYNNRGIIRLMKGDHDGALIDIDKAIATNPRYAEPYNTRGLLRQQASDFDGALSDFNKAISLNPNSPNPYEGRGNIRSYKGDRSGALADFNKAIELNPKETPAYVGRAILHYQAGELDAALSDYNKVIELDPSHPKSYFERGVIRALKGQIVECVTDIKKGLELDPNVFDGERQASFVTPAQLLDEFIASHSGNARAYEVRGIIRLMLHRQKESDEDFRKALELDPRLTTEIRSVVKENRTP
jgi:tetratricopeptide (TPR) repeat protein